MEAAFGGCLFEKTTGSPPARGQGGFYHLTNMAEGNCHGEFAPDNDFLGSSLRSEDLRCAATGKSSPIQGITISLGASHQRRLLEQNLGQTCCLCYLDFYLAAELSQFKRRALMKDFASISDIGSLCGLNFLLA